MQYVQLTDAREGQAARVSLRVTTVVRPVTTSVPRDYRGCTQVMRYLCAVAAMFVLRCGSLEQDQCLDAGGRWHQKDQACEGAESYYRGKRYVPEIGR